MESCALVWEKTRLLTSRRCVLSWTCTGPGSWPCWGRHKAGAHGIRAGVVGGGNLGCKNLWELGGWQAEEQSSKQAGTSEHWLESGIPSGERLAQRPRPLSSVIPVTGILLFVLCGSWVILIASKLLFSTQSLKGCGKPEVTNGRLSWSQGSVWSGKTWADNELTYSPFVLFPYAVMLLVNFYAWEAHFFFFLLKIILRPLLWPFLTFPAHSHADSGGCIPQHVGPVSSSLLQIMPALTSIRHRNSGHRPGSYISSPPSPGGSTHFTCSLQVILHTSKRASCFISVFTCSAFLS